MESNVEEFIETPSDTIECDTINEDTLTFDSSIVLPEEIPIINLDVDSVHLGMIRISPNGSIVALGTDNPSAKTYEKPSMHVKLTYDYSLDIHEVTCLDMYNVSRKDKWYVNVKCSSDSLPAMEVSFFDAVLYANIRSKLEGYDTAYTYLNKTYDALGHCINLEGLTFLPNVNAYRLPTEAEWIFAASIDWKAPYSWNESTAGYVLHDVCSMPTDTAWFCDMEGNVMELTNDWMGSFKDTTIANYIGAPSANSLGEKVVKGGSIAKNYENINLYSRGDVYAVTASSMLYYVGFRLAFGSIPNPGWMDDKGRVATKIPIVTASSADIREKMETVQAKLAFRNDETGNLAYVDYSDGILKVVEISDDIEVYHPEISPNGMNVAFCTGVEGVKGKSSVYVRHLNGNGSSLVKLDVPNAAIPRWVVETNGDTSIVYVDDASDNSLDTDFFRRGTWKVLFKNGKFGKPQKIFDGAYHGGVSENMKFSVSGSKKFRVYNDGYDDIWYNGEQTCNVSVSRDASYRVLFLDFGGKLGRKFAGENYRTHERLLVANQKGKLEQTIPSPVGYAFDHSEWVNRENMVVATLTNVDGVHEKIVLVDLKDSSVLELVKGDELWHPCLWVKPKVFLGSLSLDLDSAGVYRDAIFEDGEKTMNIKMRMFWDMRNSFELIAVGSSRTERGFDPLIMSVPSFNYGAIGGDLWTQLYLIYHYVLPHAKNLKYLVFEISPDLMKNSRLTESDIVYGQAPGYYYDRNHDFWVDGVLDEFVRIVDDNVVYSHEDSVKYVTTMGLLKLEGTGFGETPNIMRDTINDLWEIPRYRDVVDSVTEFIDSMKNKGIMLIGVVYPQSPLYKNTGAYSLHGTRRSRAIKILHYFDSLTHVYPHFVLMDENKMGYHDYTDEMASDVDHLAEKGAYQLSRRLDSLIQTLLYKK